MVSYRRPKLTMARLGLPRVQPLPAGVGEADAVAALDQQPAVIDGELHRLLRLDHVGYPSQGPPLHRTTARRVVQRVHDVERQGFGPTGHPPTIA